MTHLTLLSRQFARPLLAFLLSLSACGPSVEGDYLSGGDRLRVRREGEQLLAEVYLADFAPRGAPPAATVSLHKDGQVYRGELGRSGGPFSLSQVEGGLSAVALGASVRFERVHLEDGHSALDQGAVLSWLDAQRVAATQRLAKVGWCGAGLRSEQRLARHVAGALPQARWTVARVDKEEGDVFDRYTLSGELEVGEYRSQEPGRRGSSSRSLRSAPWKAPFAVVVKVLRFGPIAQAQGQPTWKSFRGASAFGKSELNLPEFDHLELTDLDLCRAAEAAHVTVEEPASTPPGAVAAARR